MTDKEPEDDKEPFVRYMRIEDMMDALMELWQNGLEYVDIYAENHKDQDFIIFGFNKEYMDEEYKNEWDNTFGKQQDKEGKVTTKKLSDNDYTDLI